MELNLFKTALEVEFEACEAEEDRFLNEYLTLGKSTQVAKWKKLASKCDFTEGEKILFDLVLSLKDDIVRLENKLLKTQNLLNLELSSMIEALNFDYLSFKDNCLQKDKEYYARFDINEQKIALFFKAEDEKLGKILKLKFEDQMIYNAFVVETQRNMIKTMKGEA